MLKALRKSFNRSNEMGFASESKFHSVIPLNHYKNERNLYKIIQKTLQGIMLNEKN